VAREAIEFIKAALRSPLNVSTVFPTSPALAEAMLAQGDLQNASSVVELGAGTGAITKHISKRLSVPGKYLGVELDPLMVTFLRGEFPELRFEHGPAENLHQWVPDQSVDLVISSLPWTLFPTAMQTKTVDSIFKSLKSGGVFITYICINAMLFPQARPFIKKLKESSSKVTRSRLEWRNIPPAFIFRATK
jgi:phospholipid N-methyltransferase